MTTQPTLVHFVTLQVPKLTQSNSFVGVFRALSGLEVSFEVLEYAEGGNNDFVHHLPGRVRYPNLTLSWGMTIDPLLQQWFFQTQAQAERQDIVVTLHSQPGDLNGGARRFVFADAFPVRWSGPGPASENPESWSETLEIAHSGLKLS
jgi:phage tail-like protein